MFSSFKTKIKEIVSISYDKAVETNVSIFEAIEKGTRVADTVKLEYFPSKRIRGKLGERWKIKFRW